MSQPPYCLSALKARLVAEAAKPAPPPPSTPPPPKLET